MKKVLYVMLFLLTFNLQGCIFCAAGAGAITGAAVVNDRRSFQTMTDDNNIEFTANSEIQQSKSLNANSHVVVVAYNHAVLLVGQVPNEDVRTRVESLVQSLPKVTRVYNQLEIGPTTSPFTRSHDVWITTKVKAQMLAEKGLNSSQIKVVTENGVVYLMGILTKPQSHVAADVARRVDGVSRVVTLFEYTYA